MERITFKLQLNEGYKDEYEKRHNPVWKELEEVFKNGGVKDYSIFIDDDTNELFGVINVVSKEHWQRISELDVVARWRDYMKGFYETYDDGTPKLSRMREVFHIEK